MLSKSEEQAAGESVGNGQQSNGAHAASGPSAAVIQRFMQERIAAALEVDAETLDPTAPVTSYGLDSIAAFTLTLELAEFLERDLPASLFWEFPSIVKLSQQLAEQA